MKEEETPNGQALGFASESRSTNTLATWCKELTHWKRPWCWERLKAGGEGDNRGWDGWVASLTWWTWVWAGSRSWWWTGRPGVLQSVGLQRVGHDWATELNSKSSFGFLVKCYRKIWHLTKMWTPLVTQLVKTLPAMQDTWVRSLGWEDPLEKGRLPTSVFWPGEFHGLYSPWSLKELDMTFTSLHYRKMWMNF